MNRQSPAENSSLLDKVQKAVAESLLSATAADNIRAWLTEPRYSEYAPEVAASIEAGRWQELDDVFWTVIPFGTGGRRGKMFPFGSNAINDRTIGESAQGLADYVKETLGPGAELSCAIAFDTRHRSDHFARLCAEIMTAAGFTVYFLQSYRATPELSFTVREKNCSCGIMVTASHNPPSDNAVKVYWNTGGQVLPPHDRGIIERVMNVEAIDQGESFAAGVESGKIVFCTAETDAAFQQAVVSQSYSGPRDLKVLYTPLHGVGESAVVPVLAAAGFGDIEVYAPHRQPDGDFTNVPGHVSNPENPAVFDGPIERAKEIEADVVLATDPDCDRLGVAAPLTSSATGQWRTFTGNQIAALLVDYVLEQQSSGGRLSREKYVVKTLVTTEMVRRIADSYGVTTQGNLLVGFKYIGGLMDELGPGNFLFGCEESHGYLVGQHARDKDAAVASMLMCELVAGVKAAGQTLHEKLDALYWQHGFHEERLVNQQMPGSAGMEQMQLLMRQFREAPPKTVGGLRVVAARDYAHGKLILPGGNPPQTLVGPQGDLVILDLAEDGNYVAIRPSGTEPKVKFYMFTFVPAEQLADLDLTRQEMSDRLHQMQSDLAAYVEAIE